LWLGPAHPGVLSDTRHAGAQFAGWLDDGTPVAVEPLDPCWECSACHNGDYHRCVRGVAAILGVGLDGGMADNAWLRQRR
jgi:threonine dehydrogenase-like Zn-dependent dehydrogenase